MEFDPVNKFFQGLGLGLELGLGLGLGKTENTCELVKLKTHMSFLKAKRI